MVIFDVVETLMSLDPLTGAFVEADLLSNGPRANTEAFLGRSELDVFVGTVLSVEDVGLWKPAAAVYEHALEQLGHPAPEAALVAVHAFDCHGAQRIGLTTGWAARLEHRYPEVFAPPDVTGEDLVDVVDGLIALPTP